MKSIKYLLGVVLLVAATGCEYNEDALPVNIGEVVENNGAYLRIIEIQTQGIDILNYTADSSVYRIVGELYDAEEGDLVTEVDFYVARTGASAGRAIAEGTTPFKTIPRSAFARGHGAFGDYPRATIDITVADVLTALGITTADIQIGDSYRLRWVVKLSNGKSFTSTDVNPAITGSFFNSPYAAACNVVSSVDPTKFIGDYTFSQLSASTSVAGAFANGWIWNGAQNFTRTLAVDPNNGFDGRVFPATPLAEYGVPAVNYRMRLAVASAKANNRARLNGTFGTGLGCGGVTIAYGPETISTSNFDQDNDATFTFVVRENVNAACGVGIAHVVFTMTKN